jgi:hypothetical protein
LYTYYCEMPTLQPAGGEMAILHAVIRSVARPLSRMLGNCLFRRMGSRD